MTYIELIVVLAIFAVMTAVVVFNYTKFQGKVDTKNLASDIALKIVEAQKSALSGNFSAQSFGSNKPSYGVYFNVSSSANQKQFVYFADINNNNIYDEAALNTISITKGDSISALTAVGTGGPAITNLTVVFRRPDSSALLTSGNSPLSCTSLSYVQITVTSPQGATALIKVYPSGRIQVN